MRIAGAWKHARLITSNLVIVSTSTRWWNIVNWDEINRRLQRFLPGGQRVRHAQSRLDQSLAAVGRRAGDPQLLHAVNQRRALHAELGGGALRAADHPPDRLQRAQNQRALGIPQRGSRRRDAGAL